MVGNLFLVRVQPGSLVSVLLPPAELQVPPRPSPDPKFPEEGPASLFLQGRASAGLAGAGTRQEGERPAVSRGEEEPRCAAWQGPPLLLGQDQPWESFPPLRQMEKPQLTSSGPRKEDPFLREGPVVPDPAQADWGWGRRARALNPKRHHVPSCHHSPVPKVSTQHWVPV